MKAALALGLALAGLSAAASDEEQLLSRAQTRIVEMLARAPRYTCAMEVTRENYQPTLTRAPRSCAELAAWEKEILYGLKLLWTDRLRLEVTVGEGREMFAWQGAQSFDIRDLVDMPAAGSIGSGGFAGFLTNIFDGRSASFMYIRQVRVNDRALAQFQFNVPVARSNNQFRVGKQLVAVAYEGTVTFDRETAGLVRLTVHVKEPPRASQCCDLSVDLDYSLVRMTGGDFLVPGESRHRFINTRGEEAENISTYSACREFQSESTIQFGHPTAGPQPQRAAPTPLNVPANRPVDLELAVDLNTATAAAGDIFTARLREALVDARGNQLAPAGTFVQGHLVRVQRFHQASLTMVVFQPEYVMTGAGRTPLALLPRARRERQWATWNAVTPLRWRAVSNSEVLVRSERKLGVYVFAGDGVMVPAGFRTSWITARP